MYAKMNYERFLQKLKHSGFNVIGLSFAFREFDKWQVAFIRLGGRFHVNGKIAFVICARPTDAKGLEGKIVKESRSPSDYPFKLIPNEIGDELDYKFKLNYPFERFDRDEDWTRIYEILLTELPKILNKLGVDGLKAQIRSKKELAYIEKIWLDD